MKEVIIYESKNGATRQYAEWLSKATGFPCLPASKAGRLEGSSTIILGSCVRMYAPAMGSWIKKRWPSLAGKRIALFTVAGAAADDPKRQEWVDAALGTEISSKLPHFPLGGRMNFKTMRWIDRTLMGMAIKMTAKKNPAEAEAMAREFDDVDESQLGPILAWLKSSR